MRVSGGGHVQLPQVRLVTFDTDGATQPAQGIAEHVRRSFQTSSC